MVYLKLVLELFSTAKLISTFVFISLPGFHKEKKKAPLNSYIIIALFVNRNNKNTTQQTKYFSHSLFLIFMTTLWGKENKSIRKFTLFSQHSKVLYLYFRFFAVMYGMRPLMTFC